MNRGEEAKMEGILVYPTLDGASITQPLIGSLSEDFLNEQIKWF